MQNLFVVSGLLLALLLSGCGSDDNNDDNTLTQASSFDTQLDSAALSPVTLESADELQNAIVKNLNMTNTVEKSNLSLSSNQDSTESEHNIYLSTHFPLFILHQDSSILQTDALSPSSESATSSKSIHCDSGSVHITSTANDENIYPDTISANFDNCKKFGVTMDGNISIKLQRDAEVISSESITYTKHFTIVNDDHTIKIYSGSQMFIQDISDDGFRSTSTVKTRIDDEIYGMKDLVIDFDTSDPDQLSYVFESGRIYFKDLGHYVQVDGTLIPFVINSEGEFVSGTAYFTGKEGGKIEIEVYATDIIRVNIDADKDGIYEENKIIHIHGNE